MKRAEEFYNESERLAEEPESECRSQKMRARKMSAAEETLKTKMADSREVSERDHGSMRESNGGLSMGRCKDLMLD